MVSRILISIALLCSSVAMSQDENGLTFSQVLIVDITSEVIVPEGKVWKLVSVSYSTDAYTDHSRIIIIDGHENYLGTLLDGSDFSLPMWLPANTSIVSTPPYNNYTFIDHINVIEFNTD